MHGRMVPIPNTFTFVRIPNTQLGNADIFVGGDCQHTTIICVGQRGDDGTVCAIGNVLVFSM